MIWKKQKKIFTRTVTRYSLLTSSWIFERLPYHVVRKMTGAFLNVGYHFAGRHRNIAKKSLGIAFRGEKEEKEIEEIVKKCMNNFGRGMIEMIYFLTHPEMVSQKVTLKGREYVDEALKKGQGLIAVTAHFGNFPLMMLNFALEGYPSCTIVRPVRDQVLEEYLMKRRTDVGLKTIYALPRKKCVDACIKALRNNEILFIPLDQNFGSNGGVFVDFFGQKAATATGPVVLASRTGATILPMFILRQKDDNHQIIVEPPMDLEEGKDEKDTIFINTAKITKIIEGYIRIYPQEWGWMHRRWKSRPYPMRYVPNA